MKKAALRAPVEKPVPTCLFLTTHWEPGWLQPTRLETCHHVYDDELLSDVRLVILQTTTHTLEVFLNASFTVFSCAPQEIHVL